MKQGIKNILPAFLSLLIFFVFEIVSNVDIIKQNLQFDLQTISNIVVLSIATYSTQKIVVEMKQTPKQLSMHYINNYVTILSALILNSSTFGNEITRISDFFVGWNAIWSIWCIVFSLLFTGIAKGIYKTLKNILEHIKSGGKCFNEWVLTEIKNTHKGVLLTVTIGIVLWLISMLFINKEKSEFSIEQLFKESLIFWCAWFVISILIFFFVNFSKKISQVVKDMKNTNIMKFFLWAIVGVVIVFVFLQVFPAMFPLLGNMLSFPIIIALVVAAIIYLGKEKLSKIFMINWKDAAMVSAVIILVTFVLLPIIGAVSSEGEDILNSGNIDNLNAFIELIITGIEFIKEFS